MGHLFDDRAAVRDCRVAACSISAGLCRPRRIEKQPPLEAVGGLRQVVHSGADALFFWPGAIWSVTSNRSPRAGLMYGSL